MARRVKTRYRTRVKRVYRAARGGGGKFKPLIDGLLAGAGGQIATGFIGNYGHPAAMMGVGFIRKNNVLMTEGSRELGIMLTANLFGSKGTNGGYLGG